MEKQLIVSHFIAEPINPFFSSPPTHSKTPPCPDGFIWHDQDFTIKECIREWRDFSRRGRMARNMQPQHARIALQRGSRGVGRFYFEVQTDGNQFFRLYYDRAPENALDQMGRWILLAEVE